MTTFNKVGQIEKKTQKNVVNRLINELGYTYLGDRSERANSNIETDYLTDYLTTTAGYSTILAQKAINKLVKVAEDISKSLYERNKEIYEMLRYGVKVAEEVGEQKQTIWLIDRKQRDRNHFAFAEEVTVVGEHTKRPDIVVYVNGIALSVIELKRSKISVSEGIRQNLDNQQKRFIQHFFTTIQLVTAGNETQGMRYGCIETPEKYYLQRKEKSDIENNLQREVTQLFAKQRFLELIHDFVVYDKGIKKLCRHNQYFGVRASQEHIRKGEGGIIWHTQGSGKSLTMVWLAKWIRENVTNARILVITDRQELDEQIEKVFKGINEEIYRTKSGRDLLHRLNESAPSLICSLVHKFGNKPQSSEDAFVDELMSNLPKDFSPKGNLYVFVDECHRTQSGKLHKAMKSLLRDAVFIGFTGTPLLKTDKQVSKEVFGDYIHTYKFGEAVEDKVILDLRYEARDIDQKITSQDKIDQWFDAKTRGLTPFAKYQLKKKRGTMQRVLSSRSRLEKIVSDILLDMETKDRLQSGRGNAMLIAGSIYEACKYFELFQKSGLKKCAIVTSFDPRISSIKGESTGDDAETENVYKYEVYTNMLEGKSVEDFELDVKKKFVDEPGQMKLLIVVDKLLTGFDAPSATFMYIDKNMQDHGLFQAICRVNRLDGEDKEYGYIIDYKDLFKKVEKAVTDYTGEALSGYEASDVQGLLSDRIDKAKERLEEGREIIKALCEPVAHPYGTMDYIHYFCGQGEAVHSEEFERRRTVLYKSVAKLIRAFADIASDLEDAGYTIQEIALIQQEVKHYSDVREEIKLASGDYIDLKAYEPAMRHLLDSYIDAEESKKISAFDNTTILELILLKGAEAVKDLPERIAKNQEAVAETIENNLRKLIIDEQEVNPKYYEKMSSLLDDLVKRRKEEAVEYAKYLEEVSKLTKLIVDPQSSTAYPTRLDTVSKRALYDNLGNDETIALQLDEAIRLEAPAGYKGHKIKERQVKRIIARFVDEERVDDVYELIAHQKEYNF